MSAETSTTENKGSTPLNQEAIDKLSPEDRETYDAAQAEREQAEQAALPYAWSQKLDQVTVNVPVPEGTRAKQLNIAIKRTHLTVGFKGQEPIVDGDLPGPIREDESFWTLGMLFILPFCRVPSRALPLTGLIARWPIWSLLPYQP